MSGERPWWASDPPGEPTGGPRRGAPDDAGGPHGEPGAPVCQVCPVCSFLRVVEDARPEAMEHLLEAAHHLTLAAKAVIDAHAEGFGHPGGLEHIPLDEDEDEGPADG